MTDDSEQEWSDEFAGATEAEHREAIRDAKEDADGDLLWWVRESEALLDEAVHLRDRLRGGEGERVREARKQVEKMMDRAGQDPAIRLAGRDLHRYQQDLRDLHDILTCAALDAPTDGEEGRDEGEERYTVAWWDHEGGRHLETFTASSRKEMEDTVAELVPDPESDGRLPYRSLTIIKGTFPPTEPVFATPAPTDGEEYALPTWKESFHADAAPDTEGREEPNQCPECGDTKTLRESRWFKGMYLYECEPCGVAWQVEPAARPEEAGGEDGGGGTRLTFSCPHCGTPSARPLEPEVDIHSGAVYRCSECGCGVVFSVESPDDYADRLRGAAVQVVAEQGQGWFTNDDYADALEVVADDAEDRDEPAVEVAVGFCRELADRLRRPPEGAGEDELRVLLRVGWRDLEHGFVRGWYRCAECGQSMDDPGARLHANDGHTVYGPFRTDPIAEKVTNILHRRLRTGREGEDDG